MGAKPSEYHRSEKILPDQSAKPCKLTFQQLRLITNDFSEKLGRGGFGVVYKGVLPNGQVIAVKKLLGLSVPGHQDDKQFDNEVEHLLSLKHRNIVRLVGWCYDIQKTYVEHEGKYVPAEMMPQRLLCLEFAPKGSLDMHISDESHGLHWQKRYKIIVGICRGLHYLHDHATPTIHLDLKPANILLDDNMEPKITDFGQSRLFGPQQTRDITRTLVGSFGYMAPEYVDKGVISVKSDVFSLGVIIIEIIVGHKDYPDGTGISNQDFVKHVLQNWRNRLEQLRCTSLERDYQQIETCIEEGLKCVHADPAKRPTTKEIMESLNILDGTDLCVSNKAKSPADQVLPDQANTSEAARSSTSLEPESQMNKRCLETNLSCMEMGLVREPTALEFTTRIDELMATTGMHHRNNRPRRVSDNQLSLMVNDDNQISLMGNRRRHLRDYNMCLLLIMQGAFTTQWQNADHLLIIFCIWLMCVVLMVLDFIPQRHPKLTIVRDRFAELMFGVFF